MSTGSLTSGGGQVRPDFEFQRVLVLTDFSRGANSALRCARAIARRFNSKLFLLHVIPSSVFRFISPNSAAETIHLAKEFADREMQMLLDEGKLSNLVEEGIVVEGRLWPTISETIRSRQIDLIAVGTHSRTSEQKMALGSFAEQIYRITPCQILTCPPEFTASGKIEMQRILFTTNFKPHSEQAASAAHSLGCGPGQQLTFVHVVEEPSGSSAQSNNIVKEFMIKRLAKSLPKTCVNQCAPLYEVRFGKPDEEILSTARQLHSHLITIGVRAVQKAAGRLPSALAYSIVCRSSCPVLTVYQK